MVNQTVITTKSFPRAHFLLARGGRKWAAQLGLHE